MIPACLIAAGLLCAMISGCAKQEELPESEPVNEEPAEPRILTWEEVKQITDVDQRLDAFVRLRDSKPSFDEQVELIRLGLMEFNEIAQVHLLVQILNDGRRKITLTKPRPHEEENPNQAIKDISVFAVMHVDVLNTYWCPNITDFSPLKTAKVRSLSILSCPGFSDVGVLNHIEGLSFVNINSSGLNDLRPLRVPQLKNLSLAGGSRLTSLEGLEGMTINRLFISNTPSLTDYSALSKIDGLKSLYLNNVPIKDLEYITDLELEYLLLTGCRKLQSLEGLESMRSLKVLDFSNSSLQDEFRQIKGQLPSINR